MLQEPYSMKNVLYCHFKLPSCFQSTCLTGAHLPIKPTVEYRTGSTVHIIVVLPLYAFLCQHPRFGTQERNMSAIQRAIINSLVKSCLICSINCAFI